MGVAQHLAQTVSSRRVNYYHKQEHRFLSPNVNGALALPCPVTHLSFLIYKTGIIVALTWTYEDA